VLVLAEEPHSFRIEVWTADWALVALMARVPKSGHEEGA
jgi:hypothetical protein